MRYWLGGFPKFAVPPVVNNNLERLLNVTSPKRSLSDSYEEVDTFEIATRNLLRDSESDFWLVSSLGKVIKNEGFQPTDPSLFGILVSSLTLSMVHVWRLSSGSQKPRDSLQEWLVSFQDQEEILL